MSAPRYRVDGVDRETGMDTSLIVYAESPENARVKGDMKGIEVTLVSEVGKPDALSNIETNTASTAREADNHANARTLKVVGGITALVGTLIVVAGAQSTDGGGLAFGGLVLLGGIVVFSVGRFYD